MAAFINIDAINEILLEEILPTVSDETNSPKMLLNKVIADATDIRSVGGDSYKTRIKIKLSKASGGGPRGENQDLPPHTNAKWDETDITLCRWYATGQYDGPTKNIKDTNEVVDAITDAVVDVKDMLQYQQQASFAGNGNEALAGIVDNSSTTYTLIDNEFWPGARRLRTSMLIDSFDGPDGFGSDTIGLNSEALATIPTKTTITLASTTGSQNGDFIYFEDGSGSKVDNSPGGIGQIVDGPYTGTTWEETATTAGPGQSNKSLQSIDGSSVTSWQSYVSYNATTRFLDEELLEGTADGIKLKSGDQDIIDKGDYMLYSSPEVFSRWRIDQSRDHQWVNKTEVIAGVKVVKTMVNGETMPWVEDLMCGSLILYMLNAKDLVFKSLPMEMMDAEGFRRLENKDQYRIQFKQYSQFGARRRNTHGKIRQLKVS